MGAPPTHSVWAEAVRAEAVDHRGGIEAVVLHHVALRLRLPFEASHGTEDERHSVLVEVQRTDGVVGWGECVALTKPTYTHEYAAGAFALLRDLCAPAVVGAAGSGAAGLALARWHPMAATGLEAALVDGALRATGRSLLDWLGGTRAPLARGVVIGRQPDHDALLAAVERAVAGGASLVKLKLAGPDDGAAVAAVRRRWPDLALAADANGALGRFSPDELGWVDGLGLRYLEQPVPADDLMASAELAARLATPIALDESITSPAAARLALRLGAGEIVNVKPARLGGFGPTVELLAWAAADGVSAFCGGMVELGVGRATAAACAAMAGFDLPTDLGPSSAYVAEDLTEPVVVDAAGQLVVPDGIGGGVTPDPRRLRAATVARAEVRAR